MKRIIGILVLICCTLTANANAIKISDDCGFYTGPGYHYTKICNLPFGYEVDSGQFERGHYWDWALCTFEYNGKDYWGYTPVENISHFSGDEPQFAYTATVSNKTVNVYSETVNGVIVGTIRKNEVVNHLYGEGNLSHIEFYNASERKLCRGWITESCLDRLNAEAAYMIDEYLVYASPSYDAPTIGKVGMYEVVGVFGYAGSFAFIKFYNSTAKSVQTGFVPVQLIYTYQWPLYEYYSNGKLCSSQ